MTPPRLLPGVFAQARHIVDGAAPAHGSAHVGVCYRALCGELCMPALAGKYAWCRWPICDTCRTATARSVVASLTGVPRGRINQPRMHAA